MKYREFLEHLQKFTNQKITQTEIAEGLGVSQSAITKRISRESDFTFNDLIRMQTHLKEKFKNLSFVQNQENENVTLDYYPDVFGSCGGGAFVLSEQKELMQIPVRCFSTPFSSNKRYSVINAIGESMSPTICNKDKLIVEHWNSGQIKDNRVYVFCYGDEIFVKRLIKNVDEMIIKSDNPDPMYRPRYIEKEDMNNIIIVGEIVGLMRDMR